MDEPQDLTAASVPSGHDRVVDFLRRQLLEGTLKVGDRLLPERELALRLDVSRPVVREALRSLSAFGILEIRAGYGTVVRAMDISVIGDFFTLAVAQKIDVLYDVIEVRIAIERQAVALACQRAREGDIDALEAALRRIETTFDDQHEGAGADYTFHMALVRASHSPALISIYGAVANLVWKSHLRIRELGEVTEEARVRISSHHRAIIEALAARDPAKADHALMTHYWRTDDAPAWESPTR